MGTFTNEVAPKRRKHKQRVTVPVVIDSGDIDQIKNVIEDGPDNLTGNVASVSEASETADVAVTYEARGANKTDVTRFLSRDAGLRFVTKRAKTERLCGCEAGVHSCEED